SPITMGDSSTLSLLILLVSSSTTSGFLFNSHACGCPPPPPPPACNCAAPAPAHHQMAYVPVYAQPQSYAPAAAPAAYYAQAPAVVQQPQLAQAYAPNTPIRTVASESYDAALDNSVLDSLPGQVGLASPAPGQIYQQQQTSQGGYATASQSVYGGHQQQGAYPSTAELNGFPQQLSAYAQQQPAAAGVYGGQQIQQQYAQPAQTSAVYGGHHSQQGYAQPGASSAVYGQQQQNGYASKAAQQSPAYTLSLPASQAGPQYVVADTAALNAFSSSVAAQPLPGLAASQSQYARPSAASSLPASTIQYAQVPAGVAVDQHLAQQIASEAATYVDANGNEYVQAKQNAFARQHNTAVNSYARLGYVEGGSAVREQYARLEPTSNYVNANSYAHKKALPVVAPIIDVPAPPPPRRTQFVAPSESEQIVAADPVDPVVVASAAQHDAPPPPTIVEAVDTTSLVLPTNNIIAASDDAAEVSESVRDLNTMTAPEFEQALQRAAQVPEETAPVAVAASVKEEPKHSVVAGESEFQDISLDHQGSPLTEENLLENNVEDTNVVHKADAAEEETESETLPDIHLQEGISAVVKIRAHAAPTAHAPRRDFGLARH
ncbi:hypothetical protein PFISCL1PPCAC_3825, partial [Pristionchus fissidentatus]